MRVLEASAILARGNPSVTCSLWNRRGSFGRWPLASRSQNRIGLGLSLEVRALPNEGDPRKLVVLLVVRLGPREPIRARFVFENRSRRGDSNSRLAVYKSGLRRPSGAVTCQQVPTSGHESGGILVVRVISAKTIHQSDERFSTGAP